jgi:hypothetical protein
MHKTNAKTKARNFILLRFWECKERATPKKIWAGQDGGYFSAVFVPPQLRHTPKMLGVLISVTNAAWSFFPSSRVTWWFGPTRRTLAQGLNAHDIAYKRTHLSPGPRPDILTHTLISGSTAIPTPPASPARTFTRACSGVPATSRLHSLPSLPGRCGIELPSGRHRAPPLYHLLMVGLRRD